MCLFDCVQCVIPQIIPSRWNEGLITAVLLSHACKRITVRSIVWVGVLTVQLSFSRYSMCLILFLFLCVSPSHIKHCVLRLCLARPLRLHVCVCVCLRCLESGSYLLCLCSSLCACGRWSSNNLYFLSQATYCVSFLCSDSIDLKPWINYLLTDCKCMLLLVS